MHIAHDALRVRDGGCRFPGCGRSRYVHAHHIRHWADGGETNLDNLVTLCSQHHRKVHEGNYGVRVRDGEIEFMRPDGRVIEPAGKANGAKAHAGKAHAGCFRGNIYSELGGACAESEDVCARYDGRDEDATLVIALENRHTVEYRFTIQESAGEIFSSKVPPGSRLEKEIAPQSDRRYTFRVTIDELSAEQPQARAGFMMIRGYLDDQSPSSGISFILTPVPGEK